MTNYPMGVNGSSDYFNWQDEPEIIDPAADAEAIERLAVAQALYKVVSAEVKAGDEFNLRGHVDAIMRERFEQAKKLGVAPKSFDVEIDGEKVGTYSITTTKPKPAKTEMRLRAENAQALLEWALARGFVNVDMEKVVRHFEETGEVPDGCTAFPYTEQAVDGGKVSRTSLRIDPDKVAAALGARLGEVALEMLEGE